jgi:hypothetical protein
VFETTRTLDWADTDIGSYIHSHQTQKPMNLVPHLHPENLGTDKAQSCIVRDNENEDK